MTFLTKSVVVFIGIMMSRDIHTGSSFIPETDSYVSGLELVRFHGSHENISDTPLYQCYKYHDIFSENFIKNILIKLIFNQRN